MASLWAMRRTLSPPEWTPVLIALLMTTTRDSYLVPPTASASITTKTSVPGSKPSRAVPFVEAGGIEDIVSAPSLKLMEPADIQSEAD
jgi:hypothetical protein